MKTFPDPSRGKGIALPLPSPLADVARVWAYRQRIEHEAADQFERMAVGLAAVGADERIIGLARRAAEDEKRHAVLCGKIIDSADASVPRRQPSLGVALGPLHLDPRKRALYACVSLSCITEALSTALLIEMRSLADSALVRNTVHSILEDEISHSRIGWAHLASEANYSDVRWLSVYIPGMLRDAMGGERGPRRAESRDLSPWGILPAGKAEAIMRKTVNEVILPGLKAFGVSLAPDPETTGDLNPRDFSHATPGTPESSASP